MPSDVPGLKHPVAALLTPILTPARESFPPICCHMIRLGRRDSQVAREKPRPKSLPRALRMKFNRLQTVSFLVHPKSAAGMPRLSALEARPWGAWRLIAHLEEATARVQPRQSAERKHALQAITGRADPVR